MWFRIDHLEESQISRDGQTQKSDSLQGGLCETIPFQWANGTKKESFLTLTTLESDFYTGWRRCIGCHVFICHDPQKSLIISVNFAERDLKLKASYASPPSCNKTPILKTRANKHLSCMTHTCSSLLTPFQRERESVCVYVRACVHVCLCVCM